MPLQRRWFPRPRSKGLNYIFGTLIMRLNTFNLVQELILGDLIDWGYTGCILSPYQKLLGYFRPNNFVYILCVNQWWRLGEAWMPRGFQKNKQLYKLIKQVWFNVKIQYGFQKKKQKRNSLRLIFSRISLKMSELS